MAFVAELADSLLLVGQAVRDVNVVKVPCHTGELNRTLGTQHTLLLDSCTLELPGKGERMDCWFCGKLLPNSVVPLQPLRHPLLPQDLFLGVSSLQLTC